MDRAWLDEAQEYNTHYGFDPVKREVVVSNIPPHGQDHENTRKGDQIVVLEGDQMGWRGTVASVGAGQIQADMVRLDGTKASRVTHRASAVGRVLKEVPRFDHHEDAEAWLDGQLLVPLQEYATGARVVFSSPPHLAMRLGAEPRGEWLQRHEDIEAFGRVTKFMPEWLHSEGKESAFGLGRPKPAPGYELLVTLDGEPDLIEVAARRIKRLA